jgi:ABC-type nitrate/sulfonate/bicarbonate transport system substrate-binding protein
VDAIQLGEPAATAAVKENGARVLTDWSFVAPRPVFLAGWVAPGKWLDNHPRTAKAFNNALAMAANWIAVNPSAANKLISEKTRISLAVVNTEVTSITVSPVTERDVGPVIMACRKYGLTKKTFTAADFIGQV